MPVAPATGLGMPSRRLMERVSCASSSPSDRDRDGYFCFGDEHGGALSSRNTLPKSWESRNETLLASPSPPACVLAMEPLRSSLVQINLPFELDCRTPSLVVSLTLVFCPLNPSSVLSQ